MRNPPEPSRRPLLTVGALGLSTAIAIFALGRRMSPAESNRKRSAARALGAGAAILCLSVALDSGLEHYRGRYRDPVMFLGPLTAIAGVAATTFMTLRPEFATSSTARSLLGLTAAVGTVGLGFHAYNILKRPGELSELNLFYAAPAAAPAALTVAGGFGLLAGRIVASRSSTTVPLGRTAMATVVIGLIGATAEAGLLHFRGAFQNPAMYAPVTVPPLAALAAGAVLSWPRAAVAATPLLEATAVLGIAGPLFHAYGIHRNMGGWRNWSQMILQGPPLPAPPAFLGIAIAGLGVLPLMNERAS
jgi:hypothetical protein